MEGRMLDAKKCLIAWTPNSKDILVSHMPESPEPNGWWDEYECVSGACEVWLRSASFDDVKLFLLSEFVSITACDKVDVDIAFAEFSKIWQFSEALPMDVRMQIHEN